VADVRAATPSAAAELAVPDAQQWLQKLQGQCRRLTLLMTHYLQNEQRHLTHLARCLPEPKTPLLQQMQRLDRLENQLHQAMQQALSQRQQKLDYHSIKLKHPQARIDAQHYKLSHVRTRLRHVMRSQQDDNVRQYQSLNQRLIIKSPLPELLQQQHVLKELEARLHSQIKQSLASKQAYLRQHVRTLSAVSPLNTLVRGYSITTDHRTGRVLSESEHVYIGQQVNVKLQRGELICQVQEKKDD
jgi:exodeoxyribonuclease VII large subunit